jgi:ABC-type uncharacterized transport system fused permease/ATPase subunit
MVADAAYPPAGLQITYPIVLQTPTESETTRMQECIRTTGVGFLTEREGGLSTVKRWEDCLSLGEQQRLAMARMFYHVPTFAILDECTSAVSQDVEKGLYQAAHNSGISCITISQRIALEEFHTQELQLGAACEKGWKLRHWN